MCFVLIKVFIWSATFCNWYLIGQVFCVKGRSPGFNCQLTSKFGIFFGWLDWHTPFDCETIFDLLWLVRKTLSRSNEFFYPDYSQWRFHNFPSGLEGIMFFVFFCSFFCFYHNVPEPFYFLSVPAICLLTARNIFYCFIIWVYYCNRESAVNTGLVCFCVHSDKHRQVVFFKNSNFFGCCFPF